MWTIQEIFDILPNIIIKAHYKDEALQFYQLYPV
jgi:hypothetical protein